MTYSTVLHEMCLVFLETLTSIFYRTVTGSYPVAFDLQLQILPLGSIQFASQEFGTYMMN